MGSPGSHIISSLSLSLCSNITSSEWPSLTISQGCLWTWGGHTHVVWSAVGRTDPGKDTPSSGNGLGPLGQKTLGSQHLQGGLEGVLLTEWGGARLGDHGADPSLLLTDGEDGTASLLKATELQDGLCSSHHFVLGKK